MEQQPSTFFTVLRTVDPGSVHAVPENKWKFVYARINHIVPTMPVDTEEQYKSDDSGDSALYISDTDSEDISFW